MFHPPAPPAGSPFLRDDFQYIELAYTGPAPLNLAGLRWSSGIVFDFSHAVPATLPATPSGGSGTRIVLVRNRVAFESRYGSGLPVAGEFTGQLAVNGEMLRLEDATGESIVECNYDPSWFPLTDGAGLALKAATDSPSGAMPSEREYWTTTSIETDKPGVAATANPPHVSLVFVNELLANSGVNGIDKVELYSPLGADISGWYLTDDLQNPKKYRFPNGTLIAPSGFLVVSEADFNRGVNRFAFSSSGESVYVIAATSDGAILSWAHGFAFGPSDPDTTFGMFSTSDGLSHFVRQKSATLGQANLGPAVGPIVISEIQYHPRTLEDGNDNTDDEYVELSNVSNAQVALSDASSSPQGWRVQGGIDYSFLPQASLPAGGKLVLVPFDPVSDLPARDRFRALYRVSETVTLMGPYRRKLNNTGDSIELVRPALASTNGSLYVVVDAIDYRNESPWPTDASGTGASIHRRSLNDSIYGNDPNAWIAAAPSPGSSLGVGPVPMISQSPSSAQRVEGGSITLSVVATGANTLRYQWLFRDHVLDGATNSDLSLANLQVYQAGDYRALVLNEAGLAISSVAQLDVFSTPHFLLTPRGIDTPSGANVVMHAVAIGEGKVSYQWMKEGRVIPGATLPDLSIAPAQIFDAGTYSVEVRDSVDHVFVSAPARLRVLIKPALVSTPQPVTAVVGDTVAFSVAATGQPFPLVYRWRRGPAAFRTVTNSSNISVLTLTNVQFADAGKYSVSVTNIAGSSATSVEVALTVLADFDQDGLADLWEAGYGFNTNSVNEAALDSDQDGMNNRDEWLAGTDPKDSRSILRLQGQALGSAATLLRFTAVSNHTYSLLLREDLVGAEVFTVSNIVSVATNRLIEIMDPNAITSRRYYSVVTPMQPDTRVGGPTVLSRLRETQVRSGQPASMSVVATGRGTLRYQWYHDGALIPSASTSVLSWNSVTQGDGGRYRVRIYDQLGLREQEATLTVISGF